MAMARFTIAVDRPKKQGEDTGADFIRIVVWGKQAESCNNYLSKGRQVAISGRIQTGSYKNRDGQTIYTTDVVANQVEFLGSKGDNAPSAPRQEEPRQEQGMLSQEEWELPEGFSEASDDVPF